MQKFDLNLLLLASSGVLLSFFLIGFDRAKYATAVDDPRVIHELYSEHFILGLVHTFLGTIGLNHVKFFQWKLLMNLKVYYLASLALHALTGLAWIVLASFTSSSSSTTGNEGNSNNTSKKKQQQSSNNNGSVGFNFASFVLNGSIITICMVALFVLSLVYIPIFSNLSNGTSIIATTSQ
ncbi:predicted protein [Naegleria gruberi]|uniref:Predicted protein n=1 Tax=Naegleria gruberi TaxID=5762 RepID=D2V1I3_NAEGR|nr:uncharacterized protein NAEGRDRAFT_78143 [Naegleria gruberi]EFC49313.1 predicted protein [Naegleria gruberi]|eukprot:XP_002682057.1 predicted protein [Naegleria gruberi strain NEG-M]